MTVLERVVPDAADVAIMAARVERLVAKAQAALDAAGLPGRATIQGSLAKGTWLAGSADADVFLLLPSETPNDGLQQAVEAVGEVVLSNPRRKYAQHPYLVGEAEGLQVDLVPAYEITDPGQKMSAVDRTPFHTAWVLEHIGRLANDVRLAKRWCKGVDVYGADTATGGFSGYLVEVLIIRFGGFEAFIDWAAAGDWSPMGSIDDGLPLSVLDPVDASRNCAAAVTADVLERLHEAAEAFRAGPDDAFFFPPEAKPASGAQLAAALAGQGAQWLGLRMAPETDRLDVVGPQFQRAARTLADALARAGFPVRRVRVDFLEQVSMQWVVDHVQLPAVRRHEGPRADRQPNADKFRAKWQSQGLAVHAVEGVLAVDVPVEHRTAAEWLAAHAPGMQMGKHVDQAVWSDVLVEPPSSGSWAPFVSDFVQDLRPWQRA